MKKLIALIMLFAILVSGRTIEEFTQTDTVYSASTDTNVICSVRVDHCEISYISIVVRDSAASEQDSVDMTLRWVVFDADNNKLATDHTDSILVADSGKVYQKYGMDPPPGGKTVKLMAFPETGHKVANSIMIIKEIVSCSYER